MVKETLFRLLVALALLTPFAYAIDPLIEESVALLLDEKDLTKHARLISTIFSDTERFVENNRSNSLAILEELKANGLLKLYFDSPKQLQVTFSTGGNAQFFVKLIKDTLVSIGYYRYFTTLATRDDNTFNWEIAFKSEYAIDPIVLQEALLKRNCYISHMQRLTPTTWHYTIDISNADLSLTTLEPSQESYLKKSLRPYWINVSKGQKLTIYSLRGDSWFPDIALFSANMHLLKVYKRDERTRELSLYLPKDAVYIKISDLFSQANIKHGLKLILEGEK